MQYDKHVNYPLIYSNDCALTQLQHIDLFIVWWETFSGTIIIFPEFPIFLCLKCVFIGQGIFQYI